MTATKVNTYKTLLDALHERQKSVEFWQRSAVRWHNAAHYWRRQAQRWHRAWLWTFGALQLAVIWIIWRPVIGWLMGR